MSKLLKIAAQRRLDVEELKKSCPLDKLVTLSATTESELGPPLNLHSRILGHWKTENSMAVAAEFKRASPSKGDIAVGVNVSEQASLYAQAGAIVISVLTEPQWFKGSLADMRDARVAVNSMKNRALVLRKDFVVDEYQLYEAKAYGADTVLLIVAILEKDVLKQLLAKSRELGLEPLVEVANEEEMKTALEVKAKVIGVNNRNLHTFKVDMATTTNIVTIGRQAGAIKEGSRSESVLIIALSGIKTREDVEKYESFGDVSGILVGETLMRATDPSAMIRNLVGKEELTASVRVKICGIREPQDALVAAESGADFIGIIFVKKSKRYATVEQAAAVVKAVRGFREKDGRVEIAGPYKGKSGEELKRKRDESSWFQEWSKCLEKTTSGQSRPLVVGVFMDQPISEVNEIAKESGIDMIQLHGSESLSDEAECALPVIRVVHVDANAQSKTHMVKDNDLTQGPAVSLLLDTSVKGGGSGGTGKTFDWDIARKLGQGATPVPVIMAGGLTPETVADAVQQGKPWGVDVASGTESSPGVKCHDKIRAFIANAKK